MILVDKSTISEEDLMDKAIDAGAEDVVEEMAKQGCYFECYCGKLSRGWDTSFLLICNSCCPRQVRNLVEKYLRVCMPLHVFFQFSNATGVAFS